MATSTPAPAPKAWTSTWTRRLHTEHDPDGVQNHLTSIGVPESGGDGWTDTGWATLGGISTTRHTPASPERRHRDQPAVSTTRRHRQACYYADDPTCRPACTLTATIRLGTVGLCLSGNTDRSTLGKGQVRVPLPNQRGVRRPEMDCHRPQAGRRRRSDPGRSRRQSPPRRHILVSDRRPARHLTPRRTTTLHLASVPKASQRRQS